MSDPENPITDSIDIDDIKDKLSGVVIENLQNKTFTDTIKNIDSLMSLVEGYIDNLINDKTSLKSYYDKLLLLKKRGFKVANAIARLKYQIEITETSINNLGSQKKSRLVLLKNDILELTKTVLDYRIVIDDKEDGSVKQMREDLTKYDDIDDKICNSDIMQLAIISLSHMSDLQEDVYKFTPQIDEAKQYKDRNFDVGDLVETLELQKKTTQEKHDMYSVFFVNISQKHLERTKKYIKELADTAERVKNDTEVLKQSENNNTPSIDASIDTTTNDTLPQNDIQQQEEV